MDDLKQAILRVIQDTTFGSSSTYPDPPTIFRVLLIEGLDVTGKQVKEAVDELEAEGKIARAPHYYCT